VKDLSGYVFSVLRKGEFGLFRGSGAGLDPILLVAPTREHASREALKRLEHEHSLKPELNVAWAVRPLALSRHDGRMALVLEDPGGELLDQLLGQPMDIAQFLRIAIPLSAAIGQVHRHGLIHKDINPANILVDTAGDSVRLTGFGIASRLPREHQAAAMPPEVIAGSLAYMAPEQTGRMNRSIDARSDLYSLGITFYQMLTGTLPFNASDPMQWVHCHIARQPEPLGERVAGTPGPISAIVMKLLAKTAEDRYQTAAGVETDLRRCLSGWEAHRRIEPFQLGAHDISDRLLIPERLYGREREIEALLACYNRVVSKGTLEFALVSGYSGIGKSSVVNELHKVLVPSRGLFASGKCEQYKRDVPYATLAQAIQGLILSLLGQSEDELGRWRDDLREALGSNGQLIGNVIPELAFVIGDQPPVSELPPQEAQNRLQLVFRRFLGVFARKDHPLVLFLDDLQWLDAATLELLKHLVTQSEVQHLLLVGAYRDNEVGPTHLLLRTLEEIRAADATVHGVVLTSLGINDIGQLVADTVNCGSELAQPLAELVQEKTGGNPFFAIQFLLTLAQEGLLRFDAVAASWQWEMDRIRAKSYTDNVVDLMAGRLKQFSATTQEALKQFACLGGIAETATLALVLEKTEHELHAALQEAVHAGLVFHQDSTYKFAHDRIQQAAYSLIPDQQCAEVHLGIGRVLLASLTADEFPEHLFDVANQLNRGAAGLTDRDEKARVAAIDLRAGQRAKASAAYESARAYFSAGMALLDESEWASRYELAFALWLERAACEFLAGHLETAGQMIGELLRRSASSVDHAAATHLWIRINIVKAENLQAVNNALDGLRLFGIDLPAQPTQEQVNAEYEAVWQALDGRPIEHLIDLPMMTDPELQTIMSLLSALLEACYHTDLNLYCLVVCRMANVSTQHGMSGASAQAYGRLGLILGPVFHRYRDAQRFAKIAYDMVEKHGFIAHQAQAYFSTALVAQWTQSITTAIDFLRETFRTAVETGDMTCACYSLDHTVTSLLLRNDPLDAVWRESANSLEFVEQARFQDVAFVILSQQRFIATMQGRTATFSTFGDAQFDEGAFETELTGTRTATTICLYWILKLQARFLSGDYAEALAATGKAKGLLWATTFHVQTFDYFYYTVLTVAALYENGSPDEQRAWRDLLTAHGERLHEWADNNPLTFADKHTLVLAEIARLEGREADAMRLYEETIRLARQRGFLQSEGLGYELAARFYEAQGFEQIAHVYFRDARRCYLSWGADGKVRQLEELHPFLREEERVPGQTRTIEAPVEHLDLATVINVSQAVSGEMVLEKLIDTIMKTAMAQAGAERVLLILSRDDELRVTAEATTSGETVHVHLRDESVSPTALPESVLRYVLRTQESTILHDAVVQSPFDGDPYIIQRRARSILGLPLLSQAKLIGVLYLENNLSPRVFVPARIPVLKLLASQAAISLENTRLYRDLAEREAKIRRLVDSNIIGIYLWDSKNRIIEANEAFLNILGYSRDDLAAGILWTDLTPPEWRDRDVFLLQEQKTHGRLQPFEKEYFRRDGSRVPVLIGVATFNEASDQGVAFVLDLTDQKQAEAEARDSEFRYRDVQIQLAHANRVATMGQLTASIAHEVNQPIAAALTNTQAALRWLAKDPPDLWKVQQALDSAAKSGKRAGDVIERMRALFKKAPQSHTRLDINDLVGQIIVLTGGEALKNGVSVETKLANVLPAVRGDRVQLQQVILNLVVNAIEAMAEVRNGPRELRISTENDESKGVHVAVSDSGPGLAPAMFERVFDAFYTTKQTGFGVGLSICRSIIEAHQGQLWATANEPRGSVFQFTLPVD
jgi:PAS domain S-box-containing protein